MADSTAAQLKTARLSCTSDWAGRGIKRCRELRVLVDALELSLLTATRHRYAEDTRSAMALKLCETESMTQHVSGMYSR